MCKTRTENSVESFRSKHTEKGHVALHILVTLFGMSAWIGINGIFVQLPVLINVSPEGWKLPVYMVLVVQSANIGPLLYSFSQYFGYKVNTGLWILCLLTSGAAAMILLVFFHSEITVIAGKEHSLFLFILIFISALVGCFSSVLFMPYLHDFNKIYLVSYFIGEGLSGVLPSIVALPQGVDTSQQCTTDMSMLFSESGLWFSSADYFIFVAVLLLLSLSAFIILEYSPFVQKRKNLTHSIKIPEETRINRGTVSDSDIALSSFYPDSVETAEHSLRKEHNPIKQIVSEENTGLSSRKMRIYLLLLLGIFCFFGNGFLPSIQSYSCLPYGNLAYKLAITLSQISNPLACFLGLWFMTTSIKVIHSLVLVCLVIGTYVSFTALQSPTPPWQHLNIGLVIIVLSWTILIGIISYLKLTIVAAFRNIASSRTLFNVGAIMQAGSAIGAVVSFSMINFTSLFTIYDSCAPDNDSLVGLTAP